VSSCRLSASRESFNGSFLASSGEVGEGLKDYSCRIDYPVSREEQAAYRKH